MIVEIDHAVKLLRQRHVPMDELTDLLIDLRQEAKASGWLVLVGQIDDLISTVTQRHVPIFELQDLVQDLRPGAVIFEKLLEAELFSADSVATARKLAAPTPAFSH